MFKRLFLLEWRSFFRSADLGKSLSVRLLLAFLGIYFLGSAVTFGVSLHFLISELFPNQVPIHFVGKFLLYWFFLSFLIRLMMQKLPILNVKPLLVLNIPRSNIVNYTLLKSSNSFWNWMLLAVVVPYLIITARVTDFTNFQLLAWCIAVVGFEYVINYLNLYVQQNFDNGVLKTLPILALLAIIFGLDYFEIYSVSGLFGQYFDLVLEYPVLCLAAVVLAVLSYFLLYHDVKKNLFLDAYLQKERSVVKNYDLSWTNRFGELAPFLQLDMKLIWRSKRARTVIYSCLIFVLYGLLFYPQKEGNPTSLVFVGVFITGIFVINFGQFVPAWDSTYYAMLMTQNMPIKLYLESKAMLMYLSIAIMTVLSTGYLYFGWIIVWVNIACAIYNLGVNVPVILYFGSMNRKRIDLDNGNIFNYQGTGAAQWLVGIPLLIAPIIIWAIASYAGGIHVANITLIVIGLIGFAMRNEILNRIAKKYQENKYKILIGFKEVNN